MTFNHPRIAKRAADWLVSTDQFRMLHSFEQVVNLINQQEAVIAIHTSEIGMGPFSLQVSHQRFAALQTQGWGGSVSDIFAFLSNAKMGLWGERPSWSMFSADRLIKIDHELPADIQKAMEALHHAIIQKNTAKVDQAVKKLVGRGVGLTPTGDDVLMGTIFALHVLNWEQSIIEKMGEQTVGRTTSLSAAFLQAAVAGEATEPWHQLISGEPGGLENLLSIGATSGKDAWTGFTSLLQRANYG